VRVLVTGGAGFVGANLCLALAERHPDWRLIAFDNLYRRGSELNPPRLRAGGVEFVEGTVQDRDQLEAIERIDALVECSAEPSALAGLDGSTEYAVHTNLFGAYNCLELARRDDAQLVFLSTSRVYPFDKLNALALDETPSRFEISADQEIAGASPAGISEEFPIEGPRTLYGATKLAAELLIAEYASGFQLRTVVDRCGVIAGPWQMGKVDQGVFSLWMLHHFFGIPLTYVGFEGTGLQVRDLIHIDDLVELIDEQLAAPEDWAGRTVNVGGGRENSLSLRETTEVCRELTGTEVAIGRDPETRHGDVPIYISDCARLHSLTAWRPRKDPRATLADLHAWVADHPTEISAALGLRAGGPGRSDR
jgi:CDP-paratose 2-epimerase